jgi:type IV secretory pathway component VirB8
MSNLAESYQRRQPHSRDSISTISTISSYEANQRVEELLQDSINSDPNGILENQARLIFNWCRDVKIGESVTNIHYNFLYEGNFSFGSFVSVMFDFCL